MSATEEIKRGAGLGRVERVVQSLDLGTVGWGGAELDDMSAPIRTARIRSSSDANQASNSCSFLNGSFTQPGGLSDEKRQNDHGPENPLLVAGEGDGPAKAVALVPRGEQCNQTDNEIGQCQAIKTKPPPGTGGGHELNQPLKIKSHDRKLHPAQEPTSDRGSTDSSTSSLQSHDQSTPSTCA